MGILKIAETFRQIALRDTGTAAVEHRFEESKIVVGAHADMANPSRQQVP